jgi:hypothetical protein
MLENENEIDMEDDPILDDSWATNFEKNDKMYQNYYPENVTYVNNYYVYVNQENEIEKIKNEKYFIKTPNLVSREEIIEILKHSIKKNYSVLHILKYNINLDPVDVQDFISFPKKYNFLTSMKHIESIHFEKTIYMFQDLNDIIFVFYENEKNKNNYTTTKKVNINTKNSKSSNSKKTIKKRFTIHQSGSLV